MRMSAPKVNGKENFSAKILKALVYFSIFFSITSLIMVIGHVLVRGILNITPDLFALKYTSDNQSMTHAIINTVEMVALTLLICVPIGVMTAIYMVEFAKPGNKFVKISRVMTETLQGIPSIIYGLFGMLFFAYTLGWGMSVKAGTMTMVIMCLPLIIRSTEEALLAVPNNLREASYGLGARKVRTVFNVVLPAASMGVFSGIILSIGRVVGETAALMYTAGTMPQIANPNQSGRTLAIHMFVQQTEGLHVPQAYATAVVLLVVVIIINGISSYIQNKIETRERGNV